MNNQSNITHTQISQNFDKKFVQENKKPAFNFAAGVKRFPDSKPKGSQNIKLSSPTDKVTSLVQCKSPNSLLMSVKNPSKGISPSLTLKKLPLPSSPVPFLKPSPTPSSNPKPRFSSSYAPTSRKPSFPSSSVGPSSLGSSSKSFPPGKHTCLNSSLAVKKPQSQLAHFHTPVPEKRLNKFAQKVVLSKTPEEISVEELRRLTCQFQRLAGTIIDLATSDSPVSVKSLESLLSKEIQSCLGPAVNSAKIAQVFVKETRELLKSLNCEFEEGHVNPCLLKNKKGAKLRYLRADSATTICYRDRYLKELVMNALQGMCSDKAEEELAQKAKVKSEASRQRINALRDMLRVEAGLEPEAFRRGEEKLQLLKDSLERGQAEVNSAAREIDELISQQNKSVSDIQIPKSVREALRGRDCVERGDTMIKGVNTNEIKENEMGYLEKTSFCCEIVSKGCTKNGDKCQETQEEVGKLEMKSSTGKREGKSINSTKNIFTVVMEELVRKQERDQDGTVNLNERICSVKSLVSDSALQDSDDEISVEDTRKFLEALQMDIEKNRGTTMKNLGYITSLQNVENGCENGCEVEEIVDKNSKLRLHSEQSCLNFRTFLTEENGLDDTLDDISGQNVTPSHKVNAKISSHNSNFVWYEQNREFSKNEMLNDSMINKCSENDLYNVKSRYWWPSKDDIEAKKVISEMKIAMEDFKNFMKTSESVFTNEVKNEERSYDFTIEEMEHILMKISTKIGQLPICLENEDLDQIESIHYASNNQENHLFKFLTNLECCLGNNNSFSVNNNMTSSSPTACNETWFSLKTKKVSETFLFLSSILNRVPSQMKSQPLSVLIPPKSLTRVLAVLASFGYFKECFISAIVELSEKKSYLTSCNNDLSNISQTNCDDFGRISKSSHKNQTKSLVKPASDDRFVYCLRRELFENNHKDKSEDIDENLTKYEQYLGISCCGMTVQDVSDMFLFMAAVLNDVPERVKTQKISNLNCPRTLETALNILYSSKDEDFLSYADKKVSFASLTVQHASDVFLTLSKKFHDLPARVKKSNILELDPPKSLIKSLVLLTSLNYINDLQMKQEFSGHEEDEPYDKKLEQETSEQEEDKEYEIKVREKTSLLEGVEYEDEDGSGSQDNFYDAYDSSSSKSFQCCNHD